MTTARTGRTVPVRGPESALTPEPMPGHRLRNNLLPLRRKKRRFSQLCNRPTLPAPVPTAKVMYRNPIIMPGTIWNCWTAGPIWGRWTWAGPVAGIRNTCVPARGVRTTEGTAFPLRKLLWFRPRPGISLLPPTPCRSSAARTWPWRSGKRVCVAMILHWIILAIPTPPMPEKSWPPGAPPPRTRTVTP